MANRLTNGGFEAALPPPVGASNEDTYADRASAGDGWGWATLLHPDVGAHGGTWSGFLTASLQKIGAVGPVFQVSSFVWTVPTVVGKRYAPDLWIVAGFLDSALPMSTKLVVGWRPAGGAWTEEYAPDPDGMGGVWESMVLTPFDATSTSTELRIRVERYGSRTGDSVWFVDDVRLESNDVAVILGELGRKALLLTLQNNLSAELAHIVNERGDSLALAAPSSWYGFERQAETPDDVECAVYRSPDGISFPSWEEQWMGEMTGSRAGNIHSEVGMIVTVTHANRDNVLPSQMQDRSDRYAAAILRVFRDNKTLGAADIFVVPERVAISEIDVSKTSPNISKVDRVEVSVRVVMTEGPTGETNVGGGVPPAAATETV